MGYRVETIIDGESAAGVKGSYLGFVESARVYAEWSEGTTRGRIAVRHTHSTGAGKQSAGNLNALPGGTNSLRIDGPVSEIESEIVREVEDGTVTVTVVVKAEVG